MTPRHCHYKEKENGWPHPPTAERTTRTYSIGARRRQKKEWQAEEDIAVYFQRGPGRDGCQLACSMKDLQ